MVREHSLRLIKARGIKPYSPTIWLSTCIKMYLDGGLVGCVVYLVSVVQSASIGQARYFPGVVWDVITDDMANGSLRETNGELALQWGGLVHVHDDGREPNQNGNLVTYLQNHRRRRNRRRKHRRNKKKMGLLREMAEQDTFRTARRLADSASSTGRQLTEPVDDALPLKIEGQLTNSTDVPPAFQKGNQVPDPVASHTVPQLINSMADPAASKAGNHLTNSTGAPVTNSTAEPAARQLVDPMEDPLAMLLQGKQAQDDDDYDDGYDDGNDDGYDDDGYDDDGYDPPPGNQLGGSQNSVRRRKPSSGSSANNNFDDDDDDGYDDDGYDDDGYDDDGYDDDDYDDDDGGGGGGGGGGGVDNQRDPTVEISSNSANYNNQYADRTKSFKRIDVEYQEPDDNENIFVEIKDDEEVVVTKEKKKKVSVPVKKKPVKQEEEDDEDEDDDEEDNEEDEEEEDDEDGEEEDDRDDDEDDDDDDDEGDDDEEDERSAKV